MTGLRKRNSDRLSRVLYRFGTGIILFVASSTLSSQTPPVEVSSGCSQCRITLDKLYTTQDPEGAIADLPSSLFLTTSDMLVVGARYTLQNLPTVFHKTGRFAHMIGRPGRGPGEIATPLWTAHLAGDTMRVFMLGRAADFTVSGEFVRNISLSGGSGMVNSLHLFPDGSHVVNPAAPPRASGPTIIFRSADGTVLTRSSLFHTEPMPVLVLFGRAREHDAKQVWVVERGSATPRGYIARLISIEGKVVHSIRHNPPRWQ